MLKWIIANPWVLLGIVILVAAGGLALYWKGYATAERRCEAVALREQLRQKDMRIAALEADYAFGQALVVSLRADNAVIQSDLDAAKREISAYAPPDDCFIPADLVGLLDLAGTGTNTVPPARRADGAAPGAQAARGSLACKPAFTRWAEERAQFRAQREQLIGLQSFVGRRCQ